MSWTVLKYNLHMPAGTFTRYPEYSGKLHHGSVSSPAQPLRRFPSPKMNSSSLVGFPPKYPSSSLIRFLAFQRDLRAMCQWSFLLSLHRKTHDRAVFWTFVVNQPSKQAPILNLESGTEKPHSSRPSNRAPFWGALQIPSSTLYS